MGNLCGGATGDVQLSPSEGTKKKKKKKKLGTKAQSVEVGDVVESVENPMVSRKKKRASALLPPGTDSLSPPRSSNKAFEASRVPSATPSAVPETLASSSGPSPVKLDGTVKPEKPPQPNEVENPGKYGWLYRENEQYEHDKNEDPYLKVIDGFRLTDFASPNHVLNRASLLLCQRTEMGFYIQQ